MSFDFVFHPVEEVDLWMSDLFVGAPFGVALVLAFLLGLRHASDPDHLVAVTSIVAADGTRMGRAVRLGVWWGIGHALTLLAIGLPLILLQSELPPWVESGAELGIGVVIVGLATRVCWKWARGDYRADRHDHAHSSDVDALHRHRHLRRGDDRGGHIHGDTVRGPRQAFAIGLLHGLAGTGAVVVLLVAGLPSTAAAAAALAVFAPMSVVSMAGMTWAWSWILTRPAIEPLYRTVLIPLLGAFGVMFGLWYAG